MSLEMQTDPLVPGQTPSISGCKQLEETTTSLGTTGGFSTPVCKVDVTANPPGDLCRRPVRRDVLSERTSTPLPLRYDRKFFRARNTAG